MVLFLAKNLEILVYMVLAYWFRRLLVMISMLAQSTACSGLSGASSSQIY